MNILVTGAAGFIGSHFIKLLYKQGCQNVSIIDKLTYASDVDRIRDIPYRLYTGDICYNNFVTNMVENENIDVIVNFAAETHVDNSIKDSIEFINSNYVGVHNLLEIVRKNDTKDIRFLQISTDEVYGSINDGSFKENDRLNPSNPYSASKAAADLLVLSYYKTYGLDVVITRSSNNYGPYQHTEKFIPRMISDAIKGESLKVYGDGKNVRDWLYVEDNCLGIKAVMDAGAKGEIYNIGAGNEKTNNQIAKIISERFNVPIKYVKDRPGHDFRYSIDSGKIRGKLDWNPNVNFEKGIEETIKHYLLKY